MRVCVTLTLACADPCGITYWLGILVPHTPLACPCLLPLPSDLAWNILYSIEMGMRIVSLGSPWVFTYLRRPWNLFDFFMVRPQLAAVNLAVNGCR